MFWNNVNGYPPNPWRHQLLGFIISAFAEARAQLKGLRCARKVTLKWHYIGVTQLRRTGKRDVRNISTTPPMGMFPLKCPPL